MLLLNESRQRVVLRSLQTRTPPSEYCTRTETRQKRRRCAPPEFRFFVWCTKVAISLYAALSREADGRLHNMSVLSVIGEHGNSQHPIDSIFA
ncbi:hypothetical protein TNCV_3021051 [Trichonephila clavipes]|nr:hypothetical protein TNCV_3021051 [Trichonephila clavipes]